MTADEHLEKMTVCKKLVSLVLFHLALVILVPLERCGVTVFQKKDPHLSFVKRSDFNDTWPRSDLCVCDFCNPVLTIEIKKLTALKDCVRKGIPQDLEES